MNTCHFSHKNQIPFESPGYSGGTTLFLYQYFLQTPTHLEWDPEIKEYLMTEKGSQVISQTKNHINTHRLQTSNPVLKNAPLLPIPKETLATARLALRIRIETLWQRRQDHPTFKKDINLEIRENVRALRNLRQTFTAYALPHFDETIRHWPLETSNSTRHKNPL